MSGSGLGCVKTILQSGRERKIGSNRMPLAHQGFDRVASSILLLRAGDCFEGFYTARVINGGRDHIRASPGQPSTADVLANRLSDRSVL